MICDAACEVSPTSWNFQEKKLAWASFPRLFALAMVWDETHLGNSTNIIIFKNFIVIALLPTRLPASYVSLPWLVLLEIGWEAFVKTYDVL